MGLTGLFSGSGCAGEGPGKGPLRNGLLLLRGFGVVSECRWSTAGSNCPQPWSCNHSRGHSPFARCMGHQWVGDWPALSGGFRW